MATKRQCPKCGATNDRSVCWVTCHPNEDRYACCKCGASFDHAEMKRGLADALARPGSVGAAIGGPVGGGAVKLRQPRPLGRVVGWMAHNELHLERCPGRRLKGKRLCFAFGERSPTRLRRWGDGSPVVVVVDAEAPDFDHDALRVIGVMPLEADSRRGDYVYDADEVLGRASPDPKPADPATALTRQEWEAGVMDRLKRAVPTDPAIAPPSWANPAAPKAEAKADPYERHDVRMLDESHGMGAEASTGLKQARDRAEAWLVATEAAAGYYEECLAKERAKAARIRAAIAEHGRGPKAGG